MESAKHDEQESKIYEKGKKYAFWVIVLVVAYAFILFFFSIPVSSFSIANAGVFGDSFGVLTSLFSGLAFVGLVVAIFLQREDLKLQREGNNIQREELVETRKVQEQQKEALEGQLKVLKLQQFENSFFNLLGHYNEIFESIGFAEATGKREYAKFYKRTIEEHVHLINNVYSIVNFIDEAFKIYNIDNKEFYINLFKAQITRGEADILDHYIFVEPFYPNHEHRPSVELKRLIEKYNLLDKFVGEELE